MLQRLTDRLLGAAAHADKQTRDVQTLMVLTPREIVRVTQAARRRAEEPMAHGARNRTEPPASP